MKKQIDMSEAIERTKKAYEVPNISDEKAMEIYKISDKVLKFGLICVIFGLLCVADIIIKDPLFLIDEILLVAGTIFSGIMIIFYDRKIKAITGKYND